MSIKKYRKKPIVIEAMQFKGAENWDSVMDFCNAVLVSDVDHNRIHIDTLEGVMTASQGDYIIKGVQGEFYPCKPDIFEQTYEEVQE